VLQELHADAALLEALREVYAKLATMLRLFDESSGQSRYDLPRWRLDLLTTLRELFDSMHGPFERARSGLSRLHHFAELIRESEGYAQLCGLLEFEGDMARVDLHLTVGVDGRVRKLDITSLQEHRTEPFYRGPIARLVSRVLMFLRGYRFGNVELVERWFEHVYLGVLDFLPAVLQLRGDLEFYLSACHFAEQASKKGLTVSVPELLPIDAHGTRTLEALFNPLLLLQDRAPVPCTLEIESLTRSCILTGPNSGGKTRLLQAIALTQMLGQAGFFVPARRAQLRSASGMFVSLGNETSADQQEGRLGTELLRIRRLFEHARPGSMVVLDELCSGTNPSEGEEIFQLVVSLLRELDPEVFITTHFLQFAQQLAEDADRLALCFLQVELDEDRVPTYQFKPGVAETSLASQTAARLGVSREELLALIRRHRA
jgi:DNA mismatch repair protein MutS2